MKKRLALCSVVAFIMLFLAGSLYAAQVTWTRQGGGAHTFTPLSGTRETTFSSGKVITTHRFSVSQSNTSNIGIWRNVAVPPRYFGVDMKAIPLEGISRLDAYTISTSLPNPVYDLETNIEYGPYRSEAEAVATGNYVAPVTHYIQVAWNDHRAGHPTHDGYFGVNAEMSIPMLGEYNVVDDDYMLGIGAGSGEWQYGSIPGQE